jgi:hypothetical protein
MNKSQYGRALTKALRKRGMSQSQFAEWLQSQGVTSGDGGRISFVLVSRWCSGYQMPSDKHIDGRRAIIDKFIEEGE